MFFVIKIYLAFTSTCGGSKPFSLQGVEMHGGMMENKKRVIREQRDLEAGISWNNEEAGRTGELGRQRVPVEHDERLCPGVSIRNLFMIEQFNKDGPNFFPPT